MHKPTLGTIASNLKLVGGRTKGVVSIYVYRSIIYAPNAARDVDILIILKDTDEPVSLMRTISKQVTTVLGKTKTDLNFAFVSDVEKNLCGQKSVGYYVHIQKTGKLIYGTDYLKDVRLSPESCCRWISLLADRARHSYFNQIEVDFWTYKYHKWSVYALAEVNYLLTGRLDADLRITAQDFVAHRPSFSEAAPL